MRIEFDAVDARHPAARTAALAGVSLRVESGERIAVIGPSGAGKTTFLLAAAAALRPSRGTVRIDGVDPWSLPGRGITRLRGRLFLAPQVPPLPPRQRVVTSLLAARLPAQSFAASLRSLLYPSDIPAAFDALCAFGLGEKLFERVDRLSGGERQRVGLARALLSPASLWLIDEPLSALDPARAAQAISTLVDAAAAAGHTLVATMHDLQAALARFGRIVGLRDGAVRFDLPTASVTEALLAALYGGESIGAIRKPAPAAAGAWPSSPLASTTRCR